MAFNVKDRITGRLRDLVNGALPKGNREAKVLAIASSKGGVGKTTTAVNLSVAWARRGFKVLLIDLDPQAHVGASLQAFTPDDLPPFSDVLLGRVREVMESAYPSQMDNLDLAGSDKMLAETEMVLSTKIGKEFILEGSMAITKSHYDFIVIDCPPNMGTLTLNALCAADSLLIPSDMSVLALEGVTDILKAVETIQLRLRRNLEIAGIVRTRVDTRAKKMNQSLIDAFQEISMQALLETVIPQNSALNKAHKAGKSIFSFEPRSKGAQAYDYLAEELLEKFIPTRARARRAINRATSQGVQATL